MAPTPTPIPLQFPNSSSSRHLYRLHRQALGFSHHPLGQSSVSRTQQHKPRIPDAAGGLQPSVSSAPEPPQISPWPLSESALIAPEPSMVLVGSEPKAPSHPGDLPGNIVAAVMVIVLVLGGLIGLVTGGEILRRQARNTNKRMSSPRTGFFTARKSKRIKNAARAPQQAVKTVKTSPEKFPYDEKTLTRPLPILKRERPRKLSAVWPIRGLSRALRNHRSAPVQVERRSQYSPPVASPQTTWSEFTPVSLYVAPPRTVTVLDRIPEECEEEGESEAGASQASFQSDCLGNFDGRESPRTEERCCRNACRGGGKDEDNKSLGSSAPDMTTDGDESSRSSLESLEDETDRESLKEVFELRRAQTTSMQMNKGVLLSLSLRTLDETKNLAPTDGARPRSGSPGLDEDYVAIERELSLAILGGTFSAVNLSPPSMLPVIPSFVSGF